MNETLLAAYDWTNFIGLICIPLTMYAMKLWGKWSENRSKRSNDIFKKGYNKALEDKADAEQIDEQKQLIVDVATLKRVVSGELSVQSTDLKATQRADVGHVVAQVQTLSAKFDEMVNSTDSTNTRMALDINKNHTDVENLRHLTNNQLGAITLGIQELKDGQAAHAEQLEKLSVGQQRLNAWSEEHSAEDRANFAKVLNNGNHPTQEAA